MEAIPVITFIFIYLYVVLLTGQIKIAIQEV